MPEKKYIFTYSTNLNHYKAEAFTIRCIDDRFWPAFKEFLKKKKIKHLDPLSLAGGPKILASPEKLLDSDFVLRQLEKSIKLHQTKKVMLFSHHDCGAYGGFANFGNDKKKELQFHIKELQKARKKILTRFPQLIVEAYFIDKNGILKLS